MTCNINIIRLELVTTMPNTYLPGVLYVSNEFQTASHLCCCGCGTRVVTPLGPGRWQLEIDKSGPTLCPSIGNTSQACRSHYFIQNGNVLWAREMSNEEHLLAIGADRRILMEQFQPSMGLFGHLKSWVIRFLSSMRRH